MSGAGASSYWCPQAWLGAAPVARLRVAVADGRVVALTPGTDPVPGDVVLPGVVLPGLANAHSHAFHRALRGRGGAGGGDFWTWRRAMYALAAALDPDACHAIARAVYAEMALAGVTGVGEMHYVHHAPDGRPYADPNAMADALRAAAREAGVRLTLLDTCYLAGGVGRDLEGVQRRFGDGDAGRWAERVDLLRDDDGFRVGAAVHSVRAVPRDQVPTVVAWARGRGAPLHAHVSEQRAEDEEVLAAHGLTPTRLLEDAGFLGPASTVVHAVHVMPADVERIGASRTTTCLCPTTERDLADGLAPGGALRDAGSPVCVGTDQHVEVDVLAEARAVEMHERLATGRRGSFTPGELVTAATAAGHASIGWPDAGTLAVGARADLVAVRTDTVRTVGADPAQLALVATAADVDTVVVDGAVVVRGGAHRLGDVAGLLGRAVADLQARVDR
ncbi:formimidoylglutamate deiminase [Actinotalea solisilvae]|uniref:formimidoylglutamate deiminase n=1 Tax=Actinotalea solisilvae TaxID=2072922 RepID=UPI0018F1C5C6|nr:formimidoylglutamate deiminase [Actinotalea solisilvae]